MTTTTCSYREIKRKKNVFSDCGPLPALDHGSVDTADGDGLTARYSCNFGYYLMGNQTLLCTSAGEWAGSPPSCTIYGREIYNWTVKTLLRM